MVRLGQRAVQRACAGLLRLHRAREPSMSTCFWEGRAIRLRAIEAPDWEVFHEWNQDDDMARRLYAVPFPQSQEAVRMWTERMATQTPDGDAFHLVIATLAGEVV